MVKLVGSKSGLLEVAIRESFPYNKANVEESKARERGEEKEGPLSW